MKSALKVSKFLWKNHIKDLTANPQFALYEPPAAG